MTNPLKTTKPMAATAALGKKAGPRSMLDGDALGDVRRGRVDDAKKSGLSSKAVDKEERALQRQLQEQDQVFAEFRKLLQAEGLVLPVSGLLTGLRRTPGLDPIWGQLAAFDWDQLLARAVRLRLRRTPIRKQANNMEGDVREVLARYLDEVLDETELALERAFRDVRSNNLRVEFDTSHHLKVELATLERRAGNRTIRLGTDRLVGVAEIDVQPFLRGTEGTLYSSGKATPTLSVEVKGYSTVVGGVRQQAKLGDRASQGYLVLGGDTFWFLDYERLAVRHLVVAPKGKYLKAAEAEAAKLVKEGLDIEVVAYAEKLDRQVKLVSRLLLEAAEKVVKARKKAGR